METYKLDFTILELEIFTYLGIKSGEMFSQWDIAKALKVSPTAVSNVIKNLTIKDLVKLNKNNQFYII